MKAKAIGMVAAILLLAGWMAGTARAVDFTLTGSQPLTVNTAYGKGWLYNQSKAWVVLGGSVSNELYTRDSSTLYVSGGSVNTLFAQDTSTVYVSDGDIGNVVYAHQYSTVEVTGGYIGSMVTYDHSQASFSDQTLGYLVTHDTSIVDISNGTLIDLKAYETSKVTLHGYNFQATGGLSIAGDEVLGTGVLSGKWFDGTEWTIPISAHNTGATISLVTPEPATLSLLALLALSLPKRGGLAMIRRRGKK